MPYAALTQQAEYFLGKEEVVGSSPTGGSGRVLYGAVLCSGSPMEEAADSSPAQCRFESDSEYLHNRERAAIVFVLALVAQLVEASVLGTEGCQFESDREYAVLSKSGGSMDLGSFFAMIAGFLVYVGPVGVMALFLWYMNTKKGWNWSTTVVAMIFGLLLGATVPGLGPAVKDGLDNISTSISRSIE